MLHSKISGCILVLLSADVILADFREHPNWPRKTEQICGESYNDNSDRIFGGRNAALGQYPWIARILIEVGEGQYFFVCGGTLITSQHVLTASHCVPIGPYQLAAVILGEYDTSHDPDCVEDICAANHQVIKISKITALTAYTSRNKLNDILLLNLESRAELNVGWGLTESNKESTILQRVRLPTVRFDECLYLKHPLNESTQFCAGSESDAKDTCRGDSGGPVMTVANSEYGPRFYLVGIVSYGLSCGKKPAIYTRVSEFMPFILDNIGPNL